MRAWSGETAALFASDEPLVIELKADFAALKPPREGQGRRWLQGEITVQGEQPVAVSLAIRGKFRAEELNCRVPMLWLRFDPANTVDTVFSGQRDLPLTTSCTRNSRYKTNVLQEYLAYRIYQQLNTHSLASRLVMISYKNRENSKVLFEGPAFIVEHFDLFASRINAVIVNPERFDPRTSSPGAMATHDLFQFMIANTDFSVVYQHNVLLVELDNGEITPVPFDFDWSGLVDAGYATPAEFLKLRSVRTRLYRGLCYDDEVYAAAEVVFLDARSSINQLVQDLPGMKDREKSATRSYIDKFYEILAQQQSFSKHIVKKCRSFDEF